MPKFMQCNGRPLGPIFKKWQRKVSFAPIDSNAKLGLGPALPIAIVMSLCYTSTSEVTDKK